MQDQSKANRGLLDELHRLRQRVIELERPKTNPSGEWDPVPDMADHYRAAVDNVTDAIVINVGTTRVFVNNAFLTLHGLDDMSQASGLSLDYFIVPEDKPLVRERTLAREKGEPVPGVYEYRVRRINGETRTVESSAVAINFNGQPGTLAVLRDITERKEAEDRVRRLADIGRIIGSTLNLEEVYEPFAELVRELIPFERIVITIAEPDQGVFTTAYVRGSDVADRRPGDITALASSLTEEVIRTRSGLLLQPKSIEDLRRHFTGPLPAFEAGFRSFISVPLISQDKVIGALHLASSAPDAYTERDLNLAESVGAQISGAIANGQLYEQLETERGRLRWLTMQVVAEEEEERHRVSLELHDEAGQALTALKITLGLIHSDMSEDLGPLRDRLAGAVDLTDATMEQIRLLARGLRPPELDAVGLNGTLEGYCREFASRTAIPITYVGEETDFANDVVNISFYRFLQEALTNVAKHAQAANIAVTLDRGKGLVNLTVVDDGRGFAPQTAPQDPAKFNGIGLLGLQERFELLGGRVEIESRPGHGTRLVARAPAEGSK